MRVVKLTIDFTAVYNVAGHSLAALGFLPPVLAAAAQSYPTLESWPTPPACSVQGMAATSSSPSQYWKRLRSG